MNRETPRQIVIDLDDEMQAKLAELCRLQPRVFSDMADNHATADAALIANKALRLGLRRCLSFAHAMNGDTAKPSQRMIPPRIQRARKRV